MKLINAIICTNSNQFPYLVTSTGFMDMETAYNTRKTRHTTKLRKQQYKERGVLYRSFYNLVVSTPEDRRRKYKNYNLK